MRGVSQVWQDKTFDLTRREIRTRRPFDEVVAAIEAKAPVVVPEANHQLLGQDTIAAIRSGRLDSAELRRRVESRLGPSGFMLLMKIEHDLLMGDLGRKHRSVQYAIGNPLIAKDVSDAAPEVCLYTPLRIAVLEDEKDGSTWVLYDNPESLMGSFGSPAARKIGSSLNQKIIKLVEEAL
jgi:uncharacterized protein (DUF302 family)